MKHRLSLFLASALLGTALCSGCSESPLFKKGSTSQDRSPVKTQEDGWDYDDNDADTENSIPPHREFTTESKETSEDLTLPPAEGMEESPSGPKSEDLEEALSEETPGEKRILTEAPACGSEDFMKKYDRLLLSATDSTLAFPTLTFNPSDKDADLSIFSKSPVSPEIERVLIRGMIRSEAGTPLTGALAEIIQPDPQGNSWQDSGNQGSQTGQQWGRSLSDDQGCFEFKNYFPEGAKSGDFYLRITPWNKDSYTIKVTVPELVMDAELPVNNPDEKLRVFVFNPVLSTQ